MSKVNKDDRASGARRDGENTQTLREKSYRGME